MSFMGMVNLMKAEYVSVARQATVQAELDGFYLPKFMAEHEIHSVSEGLTKIVNHINTFIPQDPFPFPEEQQKLRCLLFSVM